MGSVELANDPKLKLDDIDDIKGTELLPGDTWKSENPPSLKRERDDFVGTKAPDDRFAGFQGAVEGDKGGWRPDDPDACVGGIARSDV